MSWVNNSQRALFLMLLTNVVGVLPKFRSATWCCFAICLIIFVPRSDCAGRKGKGQSQIVAYFFSMEWFPSHWRPCNSCQNKDCYSWQLVPTSFEVDILKEWIGSCRWMVFLVIVFAVFAGSLLQCMLSMNRVCISTIGKNRGSFSFTLVFRILPRQVWQEKFQLFLQRSWKWKGKISGLGIDFNVQC